MTDTTRNTIERLAQGGATELAVVFSEYRPRLERLIAFRLDPRLRHRVDPSDILQEAFINIAERLPSYLASPDVSIFVWMRQLTIQKLVDLHRLHLRDKRSVGKEVVLEHRDAGDQTSLSIAHALLDPRQTPSKVMIQAEEIDRLRKTLDSMDEIDREVLALRHFEQMSNQETAEALGLSVTAASNRYIRALGRLAELMQQPS